MDWERCSPCWRTGPEQQQKNACILLPDLPFPPSYLAVWTSSPVPVQILLFSVSHNKLTSAITVSAINKPSLPTRGLSSIRPIPASVPNQAHAPGSTASSYLTRLDAARQSSSWLPIPIHFNTVFIARGADWPLNGMRALMPGHDSVRLWPGRRHGAWCA